MQSTFYFLPFKIAAVHLHRCTSCCFSWNKRQKLNEKVFMTTENCGFMNLGRLGFCCNITNCITNQEVEKHHKATMGPNGRNKKGSVTFPRHCICPVSTTENHGPWIIGQSYIWRESFVPLLHGLHPHQVQQAFD